MYTIGILEDDMKMGEELKTLSGVKWICRQIYKPEEYKGLQEDSLIDKLGGRRAVTSSSGYRSSGI